MKNAIIIGGGLSGLITGILLAKAGIPCTIIEKKSYPLHRVCGEFISNETVPFLKRAGIYPEEFLPPIIKTLQLTSVSGRAAVIPLDLGGFGISRYTFDNFLFEKAKEAGVIFQLNTEAEAIVYRDNMFEITAAGKKTTADVVIGSFGKRSKIDVSLGRDFMKKRSPYIGIKYHLRIDHPADLIGLHNFKDGYCGISNVEDGKTNLCYLSHRDNLRKYGTIPEMEKAVLYRNPFLKSIFENASFIFDKPETINEISFETKGPVCDHILMTGDAAGMITPLCGNGMAMAIHSASILSQKIIWFCTQPGADRESLEREYSATWNSIFRNRLWAGRKIQNLFGSEGASNVAVSLARYVRPVAAFLVKKTHGDPF